MTIPSLMMLDAVQRVEEMDEESPKSIDCIRDVWDYANGDFAHVSV